MTEEGHTLNEAIARDSEIGNYVNELAVIKKKIIQRKQELARKKHLLFDNIEDLVADMEMDMEEVDKWENKDACIYTINFEKEKEEKKFFLYFKKGYLFGISPVGYDCPRCGTVKGRTKKESYNTLAPLSGSKGTYEKCYICNTTLKDNVEIVS